ncbi:3'-5' exonuclease [Faecalibaculum rodentium]|uniref:3'-5' exonuclease n=1 Tax=Faecalibaculum rodentium TaxID=1702221 RepID=UPI0023F564B2|nr:3'-5' exonuclease [Faecalibaculum rodentium]
MDPKDIVCLDVETTGLDRDELEILQLSIVRGDGQVLMNEYFKPERHREWKQAMAVNGITPEFLKDKKPFAMYRDEIDNLLKDKKLIVGYNCDWFDIPVLQKNGIRFPDGIESFDVMQKFAPVYGEWNQEKQSWKWQKLTKCAEYYGYTFKAHDALEDVKATLHCYHRLSDHLRLKDSLEALKIQNTQMQEVTDFLQNQGIRTEVIQQLIDAKCLYQGTDQRGEPVAVLIGSDTEGRINSAKTLDLDPTGKGTEISTTSREERGLILDFQKKDNPEEKEKELLVFDSELEAMAYMSILEQQGYCCTDFAYQICEDGDEDVQAARASEMQQYSRVSVMKAGNGAIQATVAAGAHKAAQTINRYARSGRTWSEINRKLRKEEKEPSKSKTKRERSH